MVLPPRRSRLITWALLQYREFPGTEREQQMSSSFMIWAPGRLGSRVALCSFRPEPMALTMQHQQRIIMMLPAKMSCMTPSFSV